MKQKVTLLTAILFVLTLSITLTPALAISPILPHIIFRGNAEHGYVGGGSPIIKPSEGRIIVFARDSPDQKDFAFLIAFCRIPMDDVEFRVRLTSLRSANLVQFHDDYMILYGYFDVYVNNKLIFNDESGYFTFNWNIGFWTLIVGTPVTDVLAYASGSPT